LKNLFENPADELVYELALRDSEPDSESDDTDDDDLQAPLEFPSAPVEVVDWRERAVRRFSEYLARKNFTTPSA
jgi:hypothetical protein